MYGVYPVVSASIVMAIGHRRDVTVKDEGDLTWPDHIHPGTHPQRPDTNEINIIELFFLWIQPHISLIYIKNPVRYHRNEPSYVYLI